MTITDATKEFWQECYDGKKFWTDGGPISGVEQFKGGVILVHLEREDDGNVVPVEYRGYRIRKVISGKITMDTELPDYDEMLG